MEKALVNNSLVDITTFLKKYFGVYEPICPYCSKILHIYGRNSLKRNARFQHYDKDKCKTKDPSHSFNLPIFSFENLENVREIRNIEVLKKIYACSKELLSTSLPIKDFMENLLSPALEENVLFYRGLKIWMLPFILVSIPEKMSIKGIEYRFVIENGIKNLLDGKYKNSISKVFADTGKEVKKIDIISSLYQNIDTSWINDGAERLLQNNQKLNKYLQRWDG